MSNHYLLFEAASRKPRSQMTPEELKKDDKGIAEGRAWNRKHPARIKNVVDHWNQATDEEKQHGMDWYADAHHMTKHIANDTGTPMHVAAGLMANYSPQTHWATNIMTAAKVARTKKALGGKGGGVMATAGQKGKAQRMLDGEHYDKVLGGRKVKAFAHLIHHGGNADPDDPKVVIDRHALSVAAGARASDRAYEQSRLGTKGRYDEISQVYHKAAKRISKQEGRPIAAHQVQAATWLARQRLNEKHDAELTKAATSSRSAARSRAAVKEWNEYAGEHHPGILGKEPGTGYSRSAEEPEDLHNTDEMAEEGKTVPKSAALHTLAYGGYPESFGTGADEGDGPPHKHYYRRDIGDWWCKNEGNIADNCSKNTGIPYHGPDLGGDDKPDFPDPDNPREGARHLAYGETVAPDDIDTLQDASCPVCGETDLFGGSRCQVCGYIAPPKQFRDPDLTKARELDRGKDAIDFQQGQPGQVPGSVPGQPVGEPGQELLDPNQIDEDGNPVGGTLSAPGEGDAAFADQQGDPLGIGGQAQDPDQLVDPDQLDEQGNPLDQGQDQDVDPQLGGQQPDAPSDGAPGTPDDGMPDLVCLVCGYQTDASQPISTDTQDKYSQPPQDGTQAGDVCPNCGQGLLMSPAEAQQAEQQQMGQQQAPVPAGA